MGLLDYTGAVLRRPALHPNPRLPDNATRADFHHGPLKIGGHEVAPGSYYLGLDRSADGATWSLAFIDPAQARARRMDAFQAAQAPVEFRVPTTYRQVEASETTLRLVLTAEKENPRHATLTIRWGPHQLTVPIETGTGG